MERITILLIQKELKVLVILFIVYRMKVRNRCQKMHLVLYHRKKDGFRTYNVTRWEDNCLLSILMIICICRSLYSNMYSNISKKFLGTEGWHSTHDRGLGVPFLTILRSHIALLIVMICNMFYSKMSKISTKCTLHADK